MFHRNDRANVAGTQQFFCARSGWSIHQINHIEIRLVTVKPIHASSYLALPTELARGRFLLSIRNQQDESCFLYCFTKQYHNLFGPALTTSHDSWRLRSNPIFMKPTTLPQNNQKENSQCRWDSTKWIALRISTMFASTSSGEFPFHFWN